MAIMKKLTDVQLVDEIIKLRKQLALAEKERDNALAMSTALNNKLTRLREALKKEMK